MAGGSQKAGLAAVSLFGNQPGFLKFCVGPPELESSLLHAVLQRLVDQLQLPFDVLEVHVSGNFGKMDEHFEAGYGNMELKKALQTLKRMNYSRQITVEVCVDIQSGLYGADLSDPEQTAPLLRTRDAIRTAWNA